MWFVVISAFSTLIIPPIFTHYGMFFALGWNTVLVIWGCNYYKMCQTRFEKVLWDHTIVQNIFTLARMPMFVLETL